jgi:ribosomal protein S27AE
LRCVRCGGVDTMYKSPNGMHLICDQCGYAERILASEDY